MTNFRKVIRFIYPLSIKLELKRQHERALNFIEGYKTKIKVIFRVAAKTIHRPPLPQRVEGVYLNLGCGKTDHPKFINIDSFPHPHVHFVHRIDQLPMFSANSVDLIYASHCLEHFKYRSIGLILDEWIRVLKHGGVLRLSVPDFDKLALIYQDTGDPDDIVEQIMGGQNNRYNFHYAIFNKMNLTKHLLRAGFTDIREWTPGESDLTTFLDFSVWQKGVATKKYSISLNIEARKL